MVFEWDPNKEAENVRKHGIDFDTAKKVFNDYLRYEIYDKEHSGYNTFGEWEDRYITLGLVHKVLYVVYTVRGKDNNEIIRMISARPALKEERDRYVKWWESQV